MLKTNREILTEFLRKNSDKWFRPRELKSILGIEYSAIIKQLRKMGEDGLLKVNKISAIKTYYQIN